MGEEPSTSGSAASGATVTRAASDPETIREEIDATRQQLGDTIEALAERTDLRAQAKHKLEKTKAYVSKKKDDLLAKKEALLGKATEGSPESVVSAANQAAQKARENPVPLAAISAFALGWAVGRRSRRCSQTSRPQMDSAPQ